MTAVRIVATPARLGLAVFLLAVGVYANTLGNGFAMDDEAVVLNNDLVHGTDRLAETLDSQYWPGGPARLALYRPLVLASFALQWEVWEDDPRGYHAVNVLLHGAVSVAVFLLALALGAGPWAAAAAGSIFAVHPVHTEAVAGIVGQAELLAALFFLAACLLYLRRGLHPVVRIPGITLAYLLALGAKEIAATLPAVLVLLEVGTAPGGLADGLRRVRRQMPVLLSLAAAFAAYIAFRLAALGDPVGNPVAPELVSITLAQRLITAVDLWPEYVRLLVFPLELAADYSPAVLMTAQAFTARTALGLVLGVAFLTLAAAAWNRSRLLSLGIAWFPITILPVANILVPVGILLAERTLYLPSVAVALAAAGLVPLLPARVPARRAAVTALALALLLGAVRTWTRNPAWRSTETILDDLTARHPESFRTQWILASALRSRGRLDDAIPHYRSAADLVPSHYNLLEEFASALLQARRYEEAERAARRAQARIPENADPYLHISNSLLYRGRTEEAVAVLLDGLRLAAWGHDRLWDNLAYAYTELGNWRAAHAARRKALALAGAEATARQWLHLARLEHLLGRPREAEAALRRARQLATDGGDERYSTRAVADWAERRRAGLR